MKSCLNRAQRYVDKCGYEGEHAKDLREALAASYFTSAMRRYQMRIEGSYMCSECEVECSASFPCPCRGRC
jgi:hypothetical protein